MNTSKIFIQKLVINGPLTNNLSKQKRNAIHLEYPGQRNTNLTGKSCELNKNRQRSKNNLQDSKKHSSKESKNNSYRWSF